MERIDYDVCNFWDKTVFVISHCGEQSRGTRTVPGTVKDSYVGNVTTRK